MEFYDLKNYEGLYQINKNGEIKSIKRNIIMKLKTDKGYLKIGLTKDKQKFYLIHRLLAIQFIPNPNDYKFVDHIDNNPLNNDLENLRWITNSGNNRNKTSTGSSKYLGICWHKQNKKWIANIRIDGKLKHLGYFDNEEEAGAVYQKAYNEIMNKY